MRTLNLDPLWRTSIGFDRLFDLMDNNLRVGTTEEHYPPYNIARTGEDTYRITLAVAGFKPDHISIVAQQNVLTVTGRVPEKQDDAAFVYRGIAGRAFERQFNLADFVEVNNAWFEDGLLHIDLERRVPEAMKPRRIEIQTGKAAAQPDNVKTLDHSKAA